MTCQAVGFIPLKTLKPRSNKVVQKPTDKVAVKDVRLGSKVEYCGRVWCFTFRKSLTNGWFQITLERGQGETYEKRQARALGSMALAIRSEGF